MKDPDSTNNPESQDKDSLQDNDSSQEPISPSVGSDKGLQMALAFKKKRQRMEEFIERRESEIRVHEPSDPFEDWIFPPTESEKREYNEKYGNSPRPVLEEEDEEVDRTKKTEEEYEEEDEWDDISMDNKPLSMEILKTKGGAEAWLKKKENSKKKLIADKLARRSKKPKGSNIKPDKNPIDGETLVISSADDLINKSKENNQASSHEESLEPKKPNDRERLLKLIGVLITGLAQTDEYKNEMLNNTNNLNIAGIRRVIIEIVNKTHDKLFEINKEKKRIINEKKEDLDVVREKSLKAYTRGLGYDTVKNTVIEESIISVVSNKGYFECKSMQTCKDTLKEIIASLAMEKNNEEKKPKSKSQK